MSILTCILLYFLIGAIYNCIRYQKDKKYFDNVTYEEILEIFKDKYDEQTCREVARIIYNEIDILFIIKQLLHVVLWPYYVLFKRVI